MVKLMKVHELCAAVGLVGIKLQDADIDVSNLYVLVDSEDNDVYVGKASSKARHLYEDGPGYDDYVQRTYSGFVAMMKENETTRRALVYDDATFDGEALGSLLEEHEWGGASVDALRERLRTGAPPTIGEVEQILIRIHVRAGRIIGNSQFASQWEGPIGSFADTVAAVAVNAANARGVIEMRKVSEVDG